MVRQIPAVHISVSITKQMFKLSKWITKTKGLPLLTDLNLLFNLTPGVQVEVDSSNRNCITKHTVFTKHAEGVTQPTSNIGRELKNNVVDVKVNRFV
jgi:hypothetical protein